VKMLALQACAKGLELCCSIAGEAPEALIGDPGRLRQVLFNLLGNALKFTERGVVNLTIRPESVDEEAARLHFIVEDTGIGIPLEKQAHIFEVFAQVDGSTARRFGGSGLGLTISREMVRLMGGRIWVESEPNRGSAFHFTARFGIARADGSEHQAGRNTAAAADQTSEEARSLHILLAEDNSVNRKLASLLLEKHGHSVVGAANGREVLERHGQESFDVILMDLQMPEMDGFETTAVIREREQLTGSHIPIIAVTAHAAQSDRTRCLRAGMDGYVSKPINAQELFTAIRDVLEQRAPSGGVLAGRN
jgi:CheY-like chemotaxis protein